MFTDDLKSYDGLRNHSVVRHGVGEYVNDQTHVNGMDLGSAQAGLPRYLPPDEPRLPSAVHRRVCWPLQPATA